MPKDITEHKGIVSKLVLRSRYMFVTNEEEAKGLLELSKKPTGLAGMLILMDSNLVLPKRTATKMSTALSYLIANCRRMKIAILIVTHWDTPLLDKRIERQLTHSSKIVSTEWPQEVTL